ncbi:phenoloxidase-activating factor 2 [Drosophila biarmipes]|uniref:phenoloxidase-activating factor 2 n=1 Tax=Drosophila biarmipes TaxID=125945 RepID=UPI0007E69384|nr:phenoloxidase-activating factor 2 [Drosophila biarmipes]
MSEFWLIGALIFGCISAADLCQYPYQCVYKGYCRTYINLNNLNLNLGTCPSNQVCCYLYNPNSLTNYDQGNWRQATNNYQAAPTIYWQQNGVSTTPLSRYVNYEQASTPRSPVGNYFQSSSTNQWASQLPYSPPTTPSPPTTTTQRPQTEYHYQTSPNPAPVRVEGPSYPPIEASLLTGLCGVANPSGPGQYPWMVALFSRGEYFGGGSLIAPGVVLTAAHLLANKNANGIVVRAGEWDMASNQEANPHEERFVQKIEQHEDFVFGNASNDMALLYLHSPFELKAHIRTVCLPSEASSFDHKRCVMAGWGKPSYQDPQNSKRQKVVELPIVKREDCQNQLRRTVMGRNFKLPESLICAGGERGQDACTGDGGSPLFCPLENDPNRYEQAGIVSFGIRCGQANVPGTFTNVALFRDYLDLKLAGGKLDL